MTHTPNSTFSPITDLWNFIADYTFKTLERERGLIIPNFIRFSFVRTSFQGTTYGTKQENVPRANFNRKFTTDFKLESRDYPLDSSIPTAEIDLRLIAEKLGTSVDIVQFLLKMIVQEIGRMIRDEIASRRVSSLRLTFGKVGQLTGTRRTVQFAIHPAIKNGTFRQFIEIDRNGPQLNAGQREFLIFNKSRTNRVAQNPHQITTVRATPDVLRDSLRQSQSSPKSLGSKGLYSSFKLKTQPHLDRSSRILNRQGQRPSTAQPLRKNSSRGAQKNGKSSRPTTASSSRSLEDLPPPPSDLVRFFQKEWNGEPVG
eukprot:CAMPEP_0117443998 /NCGR_PEP_ID=MMETSP0759-20121206/5001_1 /TAXON_ID=63605 /ORGANISM="Percolomonas cosmopolitus, Strain WS" /LENGTH=313 /DNA_ID=CAMNT_0005236025 /DNA_START=316 /DNA_END=1258 /DNA_ORIENTATION=-